MVSEAGSSLWSTAATIKPVGETDQTDEFTSKTPRGSCTLGFNAGKRVFCETAETAGNVDWKTCSFLGKIYLKAIGTSSYPDEMKVRLL